MQVLEYSDLVRNRCYIGGEWVSGDQQMAVYNPATNKILAHVPKLGAKETTAAINAANAAGIGWRALTGKERSVVLRRWHDLIMANIDTLARIVTEEMGKPFSEAKGEILYGAGYIEWFAEEAKRVYGDVIPGHQSDKRLIVIKQPVGVVGAITPWNFPSAMLARKLAPALAAGCTIVAKPAESTPLSALALALLGEKAGIPKGVINIVTGDPIAIGKELTNNPLVRKLSFTGSTAVGRMLLRQSADTVKRVSMELGGNAPFIVFDDADLDSAVEGALNSKYRNAGQTCVCTNRFYIQDGIYEQFLGKLKAHVEAMKVGNGFDEGVQQGPLINEMAIRKVETLIRDAVEKGAQVVSGGQRHALGGTFYAPTLLRDVTPKMRIATEEIFGPVAAVFRFSSEAEVIHQANDSEYGLASYFYTKDVGRAWRVAEAIEAGMVGINTGLISTEVAPFGGIKQSGSGREGSRHGIDDYLELKYVCFGDI
ncbi:NAD-dependent succinate-semialdehyde dehydrogenase [Massilia sp. METH4]|uniref:NAD-dependent succinate-semialdehyde dehydrogenase n=1 Tax=Massilia sp. METH4 TaxID=3123041 RepID=UPI0030CB2B77